MQPSIKLFCCLAVLCLSSDNLIAQNQTSNQYRVVHWGLDDGLSQGETYHMIKDVKGFIWIGTRGGANRFDGNTFKIYTHESHNSKSLISDHVINGLVEDSLHNIWIGSEDKGISRYNIKTEDFTNFFPDSTNNNVNAGIAPFWATKNEVLCVERDYITAYNIYSSQKKILANLKGYDIISSFFDGQANTVWCLAPNPKGNEMLLQVTIPDNKINLFPLPHYSKSAYLDAEAMSYDVKRNCIWVNGNEGLLQFTLSNKQFHHINALKKYEQLKDFGRFVGITLDKQGRVWFATNPKGIIIYNPDDESVNFPFSTDSVLQKETGDANACLYCDRDGIIWSGFWLRKGIDEILPFNPVVKHYTESPKKDSLNNNFVVGAIDAGKGKVWVGTGGGINILDIKTGKFQALQQKDLPGIKAKGLIGVICIDTLAQMAWLLTDNGVFKTDMLTKKCIPVIFKNLDNKIIASPQIIPKFDGKKIFYITADDKTQSVFVMNLYNDTAHQILSFIGQPFNIYYTVPTNNFLFLQGNTDEKDNRTYENKNRKWLIVHTPIDSIRWTYITYNKKDFTYWIAGETQLFHFDKSFHIIKTYNSENGMPDIPIVGIIPDNNGNIWFHTDRSIQELNVATGQITTMSEKDGFEKQDFELLPFADKDKSGNIYYGGGVFGKGITQISPNNFIPTVSSIYLKALTINQNPFPLKESINYTDTLSLKYNQTKIAVDVGIIDFYSKGKSRIRYKLESNSLHEGWQYAPYYYTIRYEGLQPGDYHLVMQASNASNEFNGPEKILVIQITPPFWDTWWFRIIGVVFVVAVFYAVIQYRSRNLRKQNVKLEEKVIHRTKELKHSLEDLKAAQALLIQSEKMASLGELTAGIAHEIQNPLNFVNNFSEVSKEMLEELNVERLKPKAERDEQLENEILNDISQNLGKINHHGKRAGDIVKAMLEHSRSSTGVKEPTDINALADEYLRLSYHGLRAKDKNFNAEMITDFDNSIGKINIIPQDIGRVFLNLFNNAFYAVNEQKSRNSISYEPTISVTTKKSDNHVLITVRDNGNGISKNIVDKIFQPFFTTKPTGQGTGLGLSLSYDIVKAHGGEIRVESKKGESGAPDHSGGDGTGSIFIIQLPA